MTTTVTSLIRTHKAFWSKATASAHWWRWSWYLLHSASTCLESIIGGRDVTSSDSDTVLLNSGVNDCTWDNRWRSESTTGRDVWPSATTTMWRCWLRGSAERTTFAGIEARLGDDLEASTRHHHHHHHHHHANLQIPFKILPLPTAFALHNVDKLPSMLSTILYVIDSVYNTQTNKLLSVSVTLDSSWNAPLYEQLFSVSVTLPELIGLLMEHDV